MDNQKVLLLIVAVLIAGLLLGSFITGQSVRQTVGDGSGSKVDIALLEGKGSNLQRTRVYDGLQFNSNELLIKIKNGVNIKQAGINVLGIESIDKINKKYGIRGIEKLAKEGKNSRKDSDVFRWYKIILSKEKKIVQAGKNQPEEIELVRMMNDYINNPEIEDVELNYIVEISQRTKRKIVDGGGDGITKVPNDPYYHSKGSWGQSYYDLWGIRKINSEGAWLRTIGSDVIIAVIDTGVDRNHLDMKDNVWFNAAEIPNNGIDDDNNGYVDDYYGWDFVNNDNDPIDDHGHGTHVAGTIAAVGNNGVGVVGVNWRSKIMALKFLSAEGWGDDSGAAGALVYAADNGARISSNSWGGLFNSKLIEDAIKYEYGKRMVIVAAAGNANSDLPLYPAGYDDVISVAAYDYNSKKASFSNWGKIEVAAPGVDILSLKSAVSPMCTAERTVGVNYCRVSGTSMATPHVSGVAGLLLSYRPSFTNSLVYSIIMASAHDLETTGFDVYSGYGMLNASKALLLAAIADTVPDLKIRLDTDKSRLMPNSPLQLMITVTNAGSAINNNFLVEVFDGDPAGGNILGSWNIQSMATGESRTLQGYVGLPLGQHKIYAVADRNNAVKELFELNNQDDVFIDVVPQLFLELPLTNKPGLQLSPSISGNLIVWNDNEGVYLYDLSSKLDVKITNDIYLRHNPVIFGNKIVYTVYKTELPDIYMYDLGPDGRYGTRDCYSIGRCQGEFPIATDSSYAGLPDIYGERIVYETDKNGNFDVYMYDLGPDGVYGTGDCAAGRCEGEVAIATGSSYAGFPGIYGERIVYETDKNGNWDVYMYDLGPDGVYGTGDCVAGRCEGEFPIATGSWFEGRPKIYGDRIVYADERKKGYVTFSFYDLGSGEVKNIDQKIGIGDDGNSFDIFDNYIAYTKEGRTEDRLDIYLYNIALDITLPVSTAFFLQHHPSISGMNIIWEDWRKDLFDSDIYIGVLAQAPLNPSNLVVTSSNGDITLDWNDNLETDIKNYNIYKGILPNALYDKLGESISSSYIDSTADTSVLYHYSITAINVNNLESGFSIPVSSSGTTSTTTSSTSSTSTTSSTTSSTSTTSTSTSTSTTSTIRPYLNLYPSDDARVNQAFPTTNYGTALVLQVDSTSAQAKMSYLKFSVFGVTGRPVTSVILYIKSYATGADACSTTSPNACLRLFAVPDNTWTETGITWSNKPAVGSLLGALEDIPTQTTFYSLDVTSTVTVDGVYSFALDQTASPADYASFYSRDASGTTNDPWMLITYA